MDYSLAPVTSLVAPKLQSSSFHPILTHMWKVVGLKYSKQDSNRFSVCMNVTSGLSDWHTCNNSYICTCQAKSTVTFLLWLPTNIVFSLTLHFRATFKPLPQANLTMCSLISEYHWLVGTASHKMLQLFSCVYHVSKFNNCSKVYMP